MAKDYNQLFEEVMQLPKRARLLFGHEVISSVVYDDLPGPSDEEIARRIKEFEAGKGKYVDAYEGLERVKRKLARNANKTAR